MNVRRVLVCGAGGFVGGHLVKRLKKDGAWVRGVDLKLHEYATSPADDFVQGDLRDSYFARHVIDQPFDEIYQLAADMGGAGYLFTGENDADIMHNSAQINLNVLEAATRQNTTTIFYSSSACVYPTHNQDDPENPNCTEDSTYPASPDSEYGWEKLFSERLYLAFGRNYGINAKIARFHNIFGPEGAWTGGREKAPAALCRKVASVPDGGEIEVWGDGMQTRSFLYVDECVEGVLRLTRSDFDGPVNIGSDEMITINEFVALIADIAGKRVNVRNILGPEGVRGRTSDNRLILERLNWAPAQKLRAGLETTYRWIEQQVQAQANSR